jgi:hypothetical protein
LHRLSGVPFRFLVRVQIAIFVIATIHLQQLAIEIIKDYAKTHSEEAQALKRVRFHFSLLAGMLLCIRLRVPLLTLIPQVMRCTHLIIPSVAIDLPLPLVMEYNVMCVRTLQLA